MGVGAWNPRQRRGYRGLGDTASIPDWSSCGGALPFRTRVKVTPGHGRLGHFWGHWSSTRVRCRTVSLIRGRHSVMRSKEALGLIEPPPREHKVYHALPVTRSLAEVAPVGVDRIIGFFVRPIAHYSMGGFGRSCSSANRMQILLPSLAGWLRQAIVGSVNILLAAIPRFARFHALIAPCRSLRILPRSDAIDRRD